MARLRPGVTLAQAQSELGPKFQQWVATTATNDQQRANLPALDLEKEEAVSTHCGGNSPNPSFF